VSPLFRPVGEKSRLSRFIGMKGSSVSPISSKTEEKEVKEVIEDENAKLLRQVQDEIKKYRKEFTDTYKDEEKNKSDMEEEYIKRATEKYVSIQDPQGTGFMRYGLDLIESDNVQSILEEAGEEVEKRKEEIRKEFEIIRNNILIKINKLEKEAQGYLKKIKEY
jgi:hypothetical protein